MPISKIVASFDDGSADLVLFPVEVVTEPTQTVDVTPGESVGVVAEVTTEQPAA